MRSASCAQVRLSSTAGKSAGHQLPCVSLLIRCMTGMQYTARRWTVRRRALLCTDLEMLLKHLKDGVFHCDFGIEFYNGKCCGEVHNPHHRLTRQQAPVCGAALRMEAQVGGLDTAVQEYELGKPPHRHGQLRYREVCPGQQDDRSCMALQRCGEACCPSACAPVHFSRQ